MLDRAAAPAARKDSIYDTYALRKRPNEVFPILFGLYFSWFFSLPSFIILYITHEDEEEKLIPKLVVNPTNVFRLFVVVVVVVVVVLDSSF